VGAFYAVTKAKDIEPDMIVNRMNKVDEGIKQLEKAIAAVDKSDPFFEKMNVEKKNAEARLKNTQHLYYSLNGDSKELAKLEEKTTQNRTQKVLNSYGITKASETKSWKEFLGSISTLVGEVAGAELYVKERKERLKKEARKRKQQAMKKKKWKKRKDDLVKNTFNKMGCAVRDETTKKLIDGKRGAPLG